MPLPPIEEQRRIVERLDRVNAWSRTIQHLGAEADAARSSLIAAFLNQLAQEVQPLGFLGEVMSGKPRNGWSARCDNNPEGTAVLALGAVTGFEYRATAFKRTSLPVDPDAHYWLHAGDLLVTRSNTPELVGHAAIYEGVPAPCIYPDLMMRVPIDPARATERFVWYWLQSPTARQHVQSLASGTSPTMMKIGQTALLNMPFPSNLPLEVQAPIVERLDQITSQVGAAFRLSARRRQACAALLATVQQTLFFA
jgi:type I restriction enzyme S subunit